MKEHVDSAQRAAAAGDPRAQFQMGVVHFTQGNYHAALPWLQKAVTQHFSEAENLVALMALNGFGMAQDIDAACELFRAAADQDLKEAHYNLGGLLFNGLGVKADPQAARSHVRRAGELGHAPALRSLGFVYSQVSPAADWQSRATNCFAAAALKGDVLAQHTLGMRCIKGLGIERDRDAGIYWLAGAAQRGVYSSQARLGELRDELSEARISRIAGRAALAQGAFARRGALELVNWSTGERQRHLKPDSHLGPLSVYSGVLDEQLCEHLINVAAPRLTDSQVIDPETGKSLKNTVRTSRSMTFGPSMYDIVLGMISRRLAAIAGVPAGHAEPVAVLQYRPGQEYKPHFDYFIPAPNSPRIEERPGGARIVTVFAYLNDVAAGGATEFPRLNVRVQPERGRVVKFLNYTARREPDKSTLHAGLPVERGEKWLATLWFHERPIN